ncbi:(R,R)-butanediol dehydrogenase/meso-butanediol dehydrogenase/diacetyl reductase/L-idonate 5-dehydrogenase [Curtobacterium sp. PhB130]|uniref:zinc-dependent alcohol dehydrogenase n=1 Tax=unclassified Curtobacterium TaxID=257496 RepID=UPI000F4BED21|nr:MULTISPECIES: alcohol dehydrogenase catalytic domain-containing protein [unclassified Curtobacterium]ROS71843.1 (R,R)-butanediol dehydrogenase/meso-butanediol dehydrogenase/diacetyl reductase/L-idonate 5-dehydrogenase [Curtobacterium sp. PhB130]TCK58237.1 (R,R)-butanediol dehydrogenase/meso-butanediol dehydrogenase/diacetyl reductase/L-idonate 5-dehydrogenase [Curtobacterium sp. PhB136]
MTKTFSRPDTMHALRWHGARDVRYEEVPVPRAGATEVLIAVERVGLCGSDLEEYRHGPVAIPPEAVPLILGHEVVGTVVESPSGLPAPGTRVVPDVVVGCGHCWWCNRHEEGLCPQLRVRGQQQDGGLAEYMLADAATCVTVPETLDLDVAAFAEPVAVAVRAIRKAGDLTGATVAVVGGGTVGNLVAQIALASTCRDVVTVDPNASRRDLAARFGSRTAAPEDAAARIGSITGGRGADVVFECAGARTTPTAAVRLSRRGGTILLVGFRAGTLELPWLDVVLQERHLIGSAAHLWDEDVAAAVAMLARSVVDPTPLHSATVSLRQAADAYARLDTEPDLTKILVAPTDR